MMESSPITWFPTSDTLETPKTPSNPKNLFAQRMMAQVKLPSLELARVRYEDLGSMLAEHSNRIEQSLNREMAITMPRCHACKHRTLHKHTIKDVHSDAERLTATTLCDLDRPFLTGILCPDGQLMSRKSSMWPDITEIKVEPIDKSPPKFPSNPDEPYIRNDRDKPMSTASDAW